VVLVVALQNGTFLAQSRKHRLAKGSYLDKKVNFLVGENVTVARQRLFKEYATVLCKTDQIRVQRSESFRARRPCGRPFQEPEGSAWRRGCVIRCNAGSYGERDNEEGHPFLQEHQVPSARQHSSERR